jgi:hypothetical protein
MVFVKNRELSKGEVNKFNNTYILDMPIRMNDSKTIRTSQAISWETGACSEKDSVKLSKLDQKFNSLFTRP